MERVSKVAISKLRNPKEKKAYLFTEMENIKRVKNALALQGGKTNNRVWCGKTEEKYKFGVREPRGAKSCRTWESKTNFTGNHKMTKNRRHNVSRV